MKKSKKHKKSGKRRLSPEERATINRQNAQKSTGPKTEAGKEKSSMNAFKHGLTGGFCLLPDEDADVFWEEVEKLMQEKLAKGFEERQLVITIVEYRWRIRRATLLENRAYQDPDCRENLYDELRKLSLYQGRLERQMFQSQKLLILLQDRREKGKRIALPDNVLFHPAMTTPADPMIPEDIPLTREEGERYRWKQADLRMAVTRPTEGGLFRASNLPGLGSQETPSSVSDPGNTEPEAPQAPPDTPEDTGAETA